jgi:hypothetical protein
MGVTWCDLNPIREMYGWVRTHEIIEPLIRGSFSQGSASGVTRNRSTSHKYVVVSVKITPRNSY